MEGHVDTLKETWDSDLDTLHDKADDVAEGAHLVDMSEYFIEEDGELNDAVDFKDALDLRRHLRHWYADDLIYNLLRRQFHKDIAQAVAYARDKPIEKAVRSYVETLSPFDVLKKWRHYRGRLSTDVPVHSFEDVEDVVYRWYTEEILSDLKKNTSNYDHSSPLHRIVHVIVLRQR